MDQHNDYRDRKSAQFNAGIEDCVLGRVYGTSSNSKTEASEKDPTLEDQYGRGWDTGLVRRIAQQGTK